MASVLIIYLLISIIILLFAKHPYYALLLSFLFKPVIDMFWWAKFQGIISPLYISGIVIPLLAIITLKKTNTKIVSNQDDRIIIGYLVIFGILTLIKIFSLPNYIYNSIDSYGRILSVTLFFFIGKHYFNGEKQRKQLIWVTILSSVIPFLLTFFQLSFGKDLSYWSEAAKAGAPSAFFMELQDGIIRISGVYEGTYELAFLSLFVVLLILIIKTSKIKFPIWGYIIFALGMYFLYKSYARSSWILLVSSLLLFGIYRKKISYIVFVIIGVAILYATVPAIQHRLEGEIGFFLGRTEFGPFAAGRGNIWVRLVENFLRQGLFYKMTGNYGIGNPENQFLGLMFWFGYVGLASFLFLILYLTINLWKKRKYIINDGSFDSNIKLMFISIIVCSYWLAGWGNAFNTMISTQWILWTWTGILLSRNLGNSKNEDMNKAKLMNDSEHDTSRNIPRIGN